MSNFPNYIPLFTAVDFEEFGTEELGIPSLTARRIKQPDGSLRVMIESVLPP